MGAIVRNLCIGLVVMASFAAGSCGGGSGSGSSSPGPGPVAASNVLPVIVDAGPNNASVNTLFTTVTICVPGSTTDCQTIDHIQVDTGSFGLRILAPLSLTQPLSVSAAADGGSLVECTQFVGAYSWGPVALADVQVAGESARSVPIQVIGDNRFTTVPPACASTGTEQDTVMTFGANGILGIGVFEQDCGSGCQTDSSFGYYYSCQSTGSCVPTTVPLTGQVTNPVALFATDNNGTVIDLPAVAETGALSLAGSLIFGIDTQSNNASGTQTVLNLDALGEFTTVFSGPAGVPSYLDTGSNAIFFDDSSLTATACTTETGFYCPAATQSYKATLMDQSGMSYVASFTVGNAEMQNHSFTALPTLAGPFSGTTTKFDWGLPFYYGRRVATAIENARTAVGTGPYVAF